MANLVKARAARLQYSEQRRHGLQRSLDWLSWGRRLLGAAVYGREMTPPPPPPPGEVGDPVAQPGPESQAQLCVAIMTQPEYQPSVTLTLLPQVRH